MPRPASEQWFGSAEGISAEPDLELVGETGSSRAAVALVAELDPDVVVVDVSMPELNGPS